MLKRLFAALLCLCLVFSLTACGAQPKEPTPDETPTQNEEPVENPPEPVLYNNPLTGVKDFDPAKQNVRPVAVMIDNDSVAQKNSQVGVQSADVVFETEVEGGITRLMALFADVSKAPQIGNVRSARVVYLELATGFNAIYCHHGEDKTYCAPMFKQLGSDHFVVGENNCGWRHTYGSSTNWQNLYTTGEKLWNSLKSSGRKTTQKEFKAWQTFTDEPLTLSGGAANKATVTFNTSSISYFEYDLATGEYIKTSRITTNKDNVTGEAYSFKNVFVLKAPMSHYPDGKHRKINLSSGTGYYIVNGTYEAIKWKKGGATNALTFTKADGSPLTVQAGNSWVCIAKNEANISFN